MATAAATHAADGEAGPAVYPGDRSRAGRLCTRARAAGEAGGASASTPQAPPVILVDTARWSGCSTRATAPLLE